MWAPSSPKVGVGGTNLPCKGMCNPACWSLQTQLAYDGWPDGCFEVWDGRWDLSILCGKGEVVCVELRKRMIYVCCLQEVRWRGQGARMFGMKGRRYRPWWSVKGDGFGGVGFMVKEELCEKVVEVRRVSDSLMTVGVVFEEDVLRLICGYALQS